MYLYFLLSGVLARTSASSGASSGGVPGASSGGVPGVPGTPGGVPGVPGTPPGTPRLRLRFLDFGRRLATAGARAACYRLTIVVWMAFQTFAGGTGTSNASIAT